jgi:putative aldouronate transport system substrate-binding protein
MLYSENPAIPYAEGKSLMIDQAKELTGVTIEVDAVPNTDYPTKCSVLINSGDAPDIMPLFNGDVYTQLENTGALLAVSDYADQLPNMLAAIEMCAVADELEDNKSIDGKYYFFPEMKDQAFANYGLMIRKDLAEKYSIDIPTTTNGYIQVLKTLNENEPDLLGFGMRNQYGNIMQAFSSWFGVKAGWIYGNGLSYDPDSDSFFFSPTTEEYKGMVTFMNQMITEKVFDPESFTQDINQFNTKSAQGKYSSIINWIVPEGDAHEWIWMLPLQTNFDVAPKIPNQVVKLGYMTCSPSGIAEEDDFDAFLKFMDWFCYSEKAIEIGNWGVEGVTFEMVDGQYKYLSSIKTPTNPDGTIMPEDYMGIHENSLTHVKLIEAEMALICDESKANYMKEVADQNYFRDKDPTIKVSDDVKEEIDMYAPTVKAYVEEMTMAFIMGTASIEDEWDEFVAQCDEKGVPELLDLYNQSYQDNK